MTVMRAREVRINLILSIATAVLGLLMEIVGTLALQYKWFLPEYAGTTKGSGGALLLLGLLWLGLTSIKRLMVSPEKTTR